jgi:hypothetical protein
MDVTTVRKQGQTRQASITTSDKTYLQLRITGPNKSRELFTGVVAQFSSRLIITQRRRMVANPGALATIHAQEIRRWGRWASAARPRSSVASCRSLQEPLNLLIYLK